MTQPRPCACDLVDTCNLCWLYRYDLGYRRLWGGDDNVPQKPPPRWWDRAAAFAVAVVRYAASGFERVSDEQLAARQATCATCPYFTQSSCALCGCVLSVKQTWKSESCPQNKW